MQTVCVAFIACLLAKFLLEVEWLVLRDNVLYVVVCIRRAFDSFYISSVQTVVAHAYPCMFQLSDTCLFCLGGRFTDIVRNSIDKGKSLDLNVLSLML